MHYDTVFDLLDRGYDQWPAVALGASFVGLGVIFFLWRNRLFRWRPQRIAFGYVWLPFALFWTTSVAWGTHHRYHYLAEAVRTGRVNIVAGPVRNFVPMPYGGHAYERFCVRRKCFQYSDFDDGGGGFNNTSSHGGPIREGLDVRVTYVDQTIVRLEVADQ